MKKPIYLDHLEFKKQDTIVYFTSSAMTIRLNPPLVEIETPNKTILVNDVKIPELHHFKIGYTDDKLLIAFGGTTTLDIKKDGCYGFFDLKNRYIMTDLFIHENKLIFGSTLGRLFHFVIYDLEKKERLFQTSSIEARTLSYKITHDSIYALMGNSQLLCYDHDGKIRWKRFEHQYVVPGLAIYQNKIVYCSNNQLKITDGKTTESIAFPVVILNKIEGIVGDNLYAICNDKKGICCYDLSKKQLKYEIRGSRDINIRKLLLTKGKYDEKADVVDCLLFSDDQFLRVADLKNGLIKLQLGIPKIKEIVQDDLVIVRTHFGKSYIVQPKK